MNPLHSWIMILGIIAVTWLVCGWLARKVIR